MKNIRSLFIAMIALLGVVFAQFYPTTAFATADVLVKNTNGFYAKRSADGKYYPAALCFSTDGNQTVVPCREGGSGISPLRLDAASGNITTSAYTQVAASIGTVAANSIWIYNPAAVDMVLATGASGSEVDKIAIGPSGWSGPFKLFIPAGTRLSVKGKSGDVSSGDVLFNLLQ